MRFACCVVSNFWNIVIPFFDTSFDYCNDIVEGYEAKANYLWDIIMQHSSNGKWIMRFITYLAMHDITVLFNRDWIYNETWIEPNLPYDSEGEELLTEYLSSPEALMNFLSK